MQTPSMNAAREILFQGERVAHKLPADLVAAIELYESLVRITTGSELTFDQVAQMICLWVMNWTGPAVFPVGQKLWIPTRNEVVYSVRSAPWDCSVVKNEAGYCMIVMNTRMQVMEDEPQPVPQPSKQAKKEVAKAAV